MIAGVEAMTKPRVPQSIAPRNSPPGHVCPPHYLSLFFEIFAPDLRAWFNAIATARFCPLPYQHKAGDLFRPVVHPPMRYR
jgi:hypothetical protein